MLKEFKPALQFLGLFLTLYVGGNLIYGFFIEKCNPEPDPITIKVAVNTSYCLNLLGEETNTVKNTSGPTVFLNNHSQAILNIYEGCNGLNVMIVFIAFVVAFGGNYKRLLWFLPLGVLIIHVANIVRLALLYYVASEYSKYFYYFHKYVFTAILYLVIFLLWYCWVTKINGLTKAK